MDASASHAARIEDVNGTRPKDDLGLGWVVKKVGKYAGSSPWGRSKFSRCLEKMHGFSGGNLGDVWGM